MVKTHLESAAPKQGTGKLNFEDLQVYFSLMVQSKSADQCFELLLRTFT